MLRLRHVAPADFRKTETTNFFALPKARQAEIKTSRDAVCFVSKNGKQIVFVYAPIDAETPGGLETQIVPSARLRLTRGGWNPAMLQNYANALGLELEGLPRFEKNYEEMRRKNGRA